jgi:hypothetical protein
LTQVTVQGARDGVAGGAPEGVGLLTEHDFMIQAVRRHAFADDREFARFERGDSDLAESRTLDYLFAASHEPHKPEEVFDRLRWGGQFIFATRFARQAESLAREYAAKGFVLERGPMRVHRWLMGVPLISIGPRIHYFVARKVTLIPPGQFNNRFTYDVRLERRGDEYVVAKQIPAVDTVVQRLRLRQPQASNRELEHQARQLVQHVFPVFLTREAAFLQILQRDLPEEYRRRVPTALAVEKNGQRLVHKLTLNWLRKTDRTMSHIDFAVQSADLLYRLHHVARVIHLDLRLDNFVVTDDGVGFVDFGSAARAGENISGSPLLRRLFGQLMRTSQVQRVLEKMTLTGKVTSRFITCARHKVDRAVDLFFLTLQMERPDTNPYTRELVLYRPASHEADLIADLGLDVLCPADPLRPTYSSAGDLLRGLQDIQHRLG